MDLASRAETMANEKSALKGEYDKLLDEKVSLKAAYDKVSMTRKIPGVEDHKTVKK